MNIKQTLTYVCALIFVSAGVLLMSSSVSAASPCNKYQGNQKSWCETGYSSSETSHVDCVNLDAKNPNMSAKTFCLVGWNAKQDDIKNGNGGGSGVNPNSKEACDAKGGSFRLTSKGATGPQDVWTCLSKDDGAKYDKCIAMGAEWKGSICKDTKESCEKRGGTMQTVTVDQNSANAGKQECSVEMPADVNPASPIGGEGECGGAKVNLLSCSGSGEEAIGGILKLVLTIMSVGVGILAVGGIVYGAILYASAQDNAGQTKKAVEVITNTVIGLLLYGLMIAIVNWLIPGGVIG